MYSVKLTWAGCISVAASKHKHSQSCAFALSVEVLLSIGQAKNARYGDRFSHTLNFGLVTGATTMKRDTFPRSQLISVNVSCKVLCK